MTDEGYGTTCITHLMLILLSPVRNRKASDISGSEVTVEQGFSTSHLSQHKCFGEVVQVCSIKLYWSNSLLYLKLWMLARLWLEWQLFRLCDSLCKAAESIDRLQNVECLWCNIIALIIVITIHLKADSWNVCCHGNYDHHWPVLVTLPTMYQLGVDNVMIASSWRHS